MTEFRIGCQNHVWNDVRIPYSTWESEVNIDRFLEIGKRDFVGKLFKVSLVINFCMRFIMNSFKHVGGSLFRKVQIWTCDHQHIPLFHCIHSFDIFAPKTMSPPPYTAITTLPTASTATTGLSFLHERRDVPTTIY